MSDKKIRISLEDNASSGVERFASNAEKAVTRVAGAYDQVDDVLVGLIEDSKKYSKTIEERIKFVDKEIQIQQRAAKIDQTERKNKVEHGKRILQDKKQFGKAEEEEYKKKKRNLEEEKRDEDLHFQKIRAQFEGQKATKLGKEGKDAKEGGEEEGEKENKPGLIRRGMSRIGGAAHTVGHAMLEAAGFGAVLSIAGFIGKIVDEGTQLDEATHKMTGAAGRVIAGGAAYGQKESAFMGYATNVAKSGGSAEYGAKNAHAQLAFEKGFGLDIGSTMGGNRVMQASNTNLVDANIQMLNIMKKSDLYNIRRGDFTKVGDLLERSNSLNEMQANQKEEIDAQNTSMLMAGFGKVGGSFGDFRQLQTMQGVNQSLTNPDNDFKQAFLLRTLRKQNPGASFLDLKMKQEEGIFGKGTLQGVLGDLSDTFSGDQQIFSTSKMLGLTLHQSKRLMDHFKKNPDAFKDMNVGSSKELGDMIEGGFSRDSIAERGGEHTGTMERWKASFDTKTGRWGSKAISKVAEYENAFDKGGFGGLIKKMGSDITDAIVNGFNKVLGINPENDLPGEKSKVNELTVSEKAKIKSADKELEAERVKIKGAKTQEEAEAIAAELMTLLQTKTSQTNKYTGELKPAAQEESNKIVKAIEEAHWKGVALKNASSSQKNNTYQPTNKGHN